MDTKSLSLSMYMDMKPNAEDLAWDHAMDISGSVFARLRELGMSQKDLVEAIGVSPGRISQIIKGEPGMSLKTLARIETALDFDLGTGFRYEPVRRVQLASVNLGRRSFEQAPKVREVVERSFVLVTGGLAA